VFAEAGTEKPAANAAAATAATTIFFFECMILLWTVWVQKDCYYYLCSPNKNNKQFENSLQN
jgi:hypothetical protein